MMRTFSWTEAKRRTNLKSHGIAFEDVACVFDGSNIDDFDPEHSDREDRWRRLVWLAGRVVVVIYTEDRNHVRLISARRANEREARIYWTRFFGEPLG